MHRSRRTQVEPERTAVLAALADRQRRRALRHLRRTGPASVGELARSLACEGTPEGDRREATAVRAALEHRHLPKLVSADLVLRTRDQVALCDAPALEDGELAALLSVDEADWDDVLDCLAAPRRRAACAALADRDEALPLHALARELAARVPGQVDDVETLCTELHHVHVPKLAAVDLVERTDGGDAVRFSGHPVLETLGWQGPEAAATRCREEPLF